MPHVYKFKWILHHHNKSHVSGGDLLRASAYFDKVIDIRHQF